MTKFKFSVAAIAALSILGTANAGTFAEAIEGATLTGGGFFRHTTATLSDYKDSVDYKSQSGDRYQFRAFADLSSADVDGYKLNIGLLFNSGAVPLPGDKTRNDLGGSRFFDTNPDGGDGLNVNAFNISKSFGDSGITASVGVLKLATPITAGATDRGMGALVTAGTDAGVVVLGAFDNWITDNLNRGVFPAVVLGDTGNVVVNSVENNLFALGLLNPAKEGVYYNAFLAHVSDFVSGIGFAEAGFAADGLKVGAQVAYTAMKDGGHLSTGAAAHTGFSGTQSSIFNNPNNNFPGGTLLGKESLKYGDGVDENGLAKNRGLFNIQASYNADGLGAKIGYTGSFGDGYGVFPTNEGNFNLGGWVWYNTHGNGRNGINMFGSGALHKSKINVIYAQGSAKVMDNLSVSLDVANVSGNSWNVPGTAIYGFGEKAKFSFTEATLGVKLIATKNLNVAAFYGQTFGDVKYGLGRIQANFSF